MSRLLTDAQIAILNAISPLSVQDINRLQSLTDADVDRLKHRTPDYQSGIIEDTTGDRSSASEKKIYVQSNMEIGDDGNPHKVLNDDPALCGDDRAQSAGALDQPFRSIDGALKSIETDKGTQGKEIIFCLLADNRLDPDSVTSYRTPIAKRRFYMMRQLPLGTHPESYRASYSYRGPRAMHRSNVSPLVDYCQDFGDGYCKVKTATGNGQQNGFLCWPTLLSDRREVMPPIPVIGVDGSGFAIVPIIYKAMIDNVLQNHSSLGVNLEGADPAVHFFYDSDGVWTPGSDTFQGLAVTGWGPFRAGDRRSTQDYDVQRRPAFERIGFPHSTHNILGSADYDHCSFADRVRFKGGEYRFSGCISEGDANLEADCIGGYHNANAAGGLRAHEMACRLLEPMNIDTVVPGPTDGQQFTGGPGNGPGKWDPIIPQLQYFAEFAVGTNGGEGGILIVGRDNGGPPSHLRVRFGWYVRNFGAGAGVKVLGGSTLWIEKYGILAVKANTPGSQIAIRLSGGSKARINAVDGGFISNTNIMAKVGFDGVGISRTDFLDAAKWNKQAMDRGSVAGVGGPLAGGAYPKGDGSCLWDRTVEPDRQDYNNPLGDEA
jgi:hypothetical protein